MKAWQNQHAALPHKIRVILREGTTVAVDDNSLNSVVMTAGIGRGKHAGDIPLIILRCEKQGRCNRACFQITPQTATRGKNNRKNWGL